MYVRIILLKMYSSSIMATFVVKIIFFSSHTSLYLVPYYKFSFLVMQAEGYDVAISGSSRICL